MTFRNFNSLVSKMAKIKTGHQITGCKTGSRHRISGAAPSVCLKGLNDASCQFKKKTKMIKGFARWFQIGKYGIFHFFRQFFWVFCLFVTGNRQGLFLCIQPVGKTRPKWTTMPSFRDFLIDLGCRGVFQIEKNAIFQFFLTFFQVFCSFVTGNRQEFTFAYSQLDRPDPN